MGSLRASETSIRTTFVNEKESSFHGDNTPTNFEMIVNRTDASLISSAVSKARYARMCVLSCISLVTSGIMLRLPRTVVYGTGGHPPE